MTPTTPGTGSGSAPAATVPTAKVHADGSSGPVTVDVEVVQSPGLVQRGLMYRKFLPPDAGMLFLMDDDDDHYFWMKNTFIPLDILFIDKDLKVAGILHDMQPHDTNSKGVGKPSRYVLEVNAGWAKQHGVAAGTPMRFEGVEAAAR
ncbi:MAG TPA: DUF192 domain-containing protein [Kofleriaceae bacterium]|nr:DUF192 domain-containing protein [Kofleriaceae bacterium]